MSDSGTLTLKFESIDGSTDITETIKNFTQIYECKSYTRSEHNSNNDSYSFYFDRCGNFDIDDLEECTKNVDLIVHAVYHIHGDGTDPDFSFKVQDGFSEYSSRGWNGEIADSEHIDLEDLNE